MRRVHPATEAARLLEGGDGGVIEVALPVEAGRAVVGQQLAGELGADGSRELTGLLQVGRARLHPEHVGEGRIREPARDRSLQSDWQE